MKLYAAMDLHSSNNVTVVIDEQDRGLPETLAQRPGVDLKGTLGLSVRASRRWPTWR